MHSLGTSIPNPKYRSGMMKRFLVEAAHCAPYVADMVTPEKRNKEINVAIEQASAQLRVALVVDLAGVGAHFSE